MGDEHDKSIEVSSIIATAIQMQICERDNRLPSPTPESNQFWWQWACQSAYNLEWLFALYETCIIIRNTNFASLTPHTLLNPAREYQCAFPQSEFIDPLNLEKERSRFIDNMRGSKIYKRLNPPFWLKNRQVVIGLTRSEPVDPDADF
jgi:hypothetical protein